METTKTININELTTTYLYETFQGLNLKGRTFNKLHLSGCKISESTFAQCTFKDCVLQASSFENVKFFGCSFINCIVKYSTVEGASFQNCTFENNAWSQTQTYELEANFCELDEQTTQIICLHDDTNISPIKLNSVA